jgi:hypothetical protein
MGIIKNRNRYLTDSEFVELLKNGDEIRRHLPPSPPRLDARLTPAVVGLVVAENVPS